MTSPITTHILDTSLGRPAAAVTVTLEYQEDGTKWQEVGRGRTDDNGRIKELLEAGKAFRPGLHRLTFATGEYFEATGRSCFYPHVVVTFDVRDVSQHYHVPLLLNPFGYSTYRGS